jgi:hypothetical protein
MKILLFTTLVILLTTSTFAQLKGMLEGQVIDSRNQEALPGVNVVLVEQSTMGAATDENGYFSISGIPVGRYSVKSSLLGYESTIITNVIVSTGRSTKIKITLSETTLQVNETEVTGDYFQRGAMISPISAAKIDAAELKRNPGSLQDIQRVVQILPGIGNSSDNLNELIVRGGSPDENLTILDYIEIPSISHYSNQMNSAGPINMVNADLVEDFQFSSGGFPAQYGDRMSSVMNISIREGDRNNLLKANVGLNMAGFTGLFEGGFDEGRGSWVYSIRKSFLEALDEVVGMSSLSLTAIPKYWDTQGKIVYNITPSHKLMLNGLYGESKIFINGDYTKYDDIRRSVTDSSSLQVVDNVNSQYALGLSLKSLWGKEGYSVLTLSAVGNRYTVDVREDFTERIFDAKGDVASYRILSSRPFFSNDSRESFVSAKFEMYYQVQKDHEITLGAQAQTPNKWDDRVFYHSGVSRFDLNHDGIYELPNVTFPDNNFSSVLGFGDAYRINAFMSDKYSVTPELKMTLGIRYDYFSYSKQAAFSPRFSLAYFVLPPTTTLTFAYGEYYQVPSFPYFADNRDLGYNHYLKDSHSRHFVLGLEHILDEGLRLTVEGYYKRYTDLPQSEQFIYSADPTFISDRFLTVGQKYSYGLEIFLQQKQVKDYFGTISLSLSNTRNDDPRIPSKVDTYADTYDYPFIAVVSAGKLITDARKWLDESPFFIKYPLIWLPFSDDMEISVKFRYQSGKPYTPMEYVTWKSDLEAGVHWTRGSWVASDRINSVRYPDYQRLDLQWLSRFHYSGWNLNMYITLQNIYNQKNVFYQMYRSDGTIETVNQLSFFPVGGVEIIF